MTDWPSSRARQVLAALHRIGWNEKRVRMLARIARHTGLTPADLRKR